MKPIITLTTVPSRLSFFHDQGIKACINSLFNQNYDNYEIHFNIPVANVTTKEEYNVPAWLLEYDSEKLKIFRTDDLGPITKLLPTLQRVTDRDTVIIVADDDLVYHPEMVQAQVENQRKWEEAVVGYDGIRSRNKDGKFSNYFGDPRDYFFTSHKIPSRVDILQHYKTVSYKRRYFEEDFFEFAETKFSWADDLLVAAYFSFKKRDRIVETHELIPDLKTKEEWDRLGGALTFPVIQHTIHEHLEGCNYFRHNKVSDNGHILYSYIDRGY